MHPQLKIHKDCVCFFSTPTRKKTRSTFTSPTFTSPSQSTTHTLKPYVFEPETLLKIIQKGLEDERRVPEPDAKLIDKFEQDISYLEEVITKKKKYKPVPSTPSPADLPVVAHIKVFSDPSHAIPVLFGSRAMKYWCDKYGVECRDVTESDYDFIVTGMQPSKKFQHENIDVKHGIIVTDIPLKIKFKIDWNSFQAEVALKYADVLVQIEKDMPSP